ncbi:MAG: flagellar biosynthesis repressor FlbT [Litoreibacter sp.]
MSGLVLKLGPKERILINGAVIENGDKRSKLNVVTPNAKILRLRDALHPEEVDSPVKRVCYILQLVLSGDSDPNDARHQVLRGLEQLSQVFTDIDSRKIIATVTQNTANDNFYPALRALRHLVNREKRIIEAMN